MKDGKGRLMLNEAADYLGVEAMIHNICVDAINKKIDVLVFGAMGCGVFLGKLDQKSFAEFYAERFAKVLILYLPYFKCIHFAIPASGETTNYEAFKKVLSAELETHFTTIE